jgi:hypothetical protein
MQGHANSYGDVLSQLLGILLLPHGISTEGTADIRQQAGGVFGLYDMLIKEEVLLCQGNTASKTRQRIFITL